ncbi:hypothetical protein H5410_036336, partial [Solanum commersonii]
FKSYEITGCKEGAKHGNLSVARNLVRRAKFSIKVLRWLISVFIEASKVKGDSVKRWKVKDLYLDFFCTLKYNKKGGYIGFIAIQGQNKASSLQSKSTQHGLGKHRHKIAKFTYEPTNNVGLQHLEVTIGVGVFAINDGTSFRATHKSCRKACHGRTWVWKKMPLEPRVVDPNHSGVVVESYSKRRVWIRVFGFTPKPMVP